MEFTIHIKGLDALASAIILLAQAMGQSLVPQNALHIAPPTQAPMVAPQPMPMQAQTPIVPIVTAPIQTPAVTEPSQPVVQAMPTTIPTSHVAQEFTLDQIQLAMTGLVDAGKMQVISQIMASFNVAAITQLPKEQYSALVVKLREAGAQI